ncbi:uncharacterized protein LOC143459393 [Clavelina lepadiformis]|uniref:uncharacterized protein LOC143459393 n=1 Tax=Clavelina lepadiformis TaxID=159417 RepID=UPI004041FBA6
MHFKLFVMLTGSLLFSQSAHSQVNSTNHGERSDDISECIYVHGYLVGNRTKTERCCNVTVKYFERRWSIGRQYLTNYLETLRGWKCPRFEEECKQRLFNYTEYTQNVYKYFCEYETFVDSCFDEVKEAFMRNNNHDQLQTQTVATGTNSTNDQSIYAQWNSIISRLQANSLSSSDLSKPCVQVALYEADEDHLGDYHEVIHVNLPSCEVVWCGYDGETLRERIISSWTCMSSSCRAKMVSIMVICPLFGIVIAVVNILVVVVISRNASLRNSQGIYKMSLAFADLIIGFFVFPTFSSSLGRLITTRHQSGSLINVTGYLEAEGVVVDAGKSVELRLPSLTQLSSRSYLDFVGFFTVLSLTVSVYTLTVAGCDRLWAISRPLSYNKEKAEYSAKIGCICLWLVGVLFSILPYLTPTLRYSLIASILVSSGGQDALVLYLVAFLIPLVITWLVNIVTFHMTRKHAKINRHLSTKLKKKSRSVEVRLAHTLCLMAGIFTLSILPVALVILSALFVGNIYFSQPRRVDVQGALVYNAFEFVTIIILACNSLWNFFIYNRRNKDFRQEMTSTMISFLKRLHADRCSDRIAWWMERNSVRPASANNSDVAASKKNSLATSVLRLNLDTMTPNQSPMMMRKSIDMSISTRTLDKSEISRHDRMEVSQTNEPVLHKTDGANDCNGRSHEVNSRDSAATGASADKAHLSVTENIDDKISAQIGDSGEKNIQENSV